MTIKHEITIEQIGIDCSKLKLEPNQSYLIAYPEFVRFFSERKKLTEHDVIIGSHFIYGWMPTILKKISGINGILPLWDQAKTEKLLEPKDLDLIRICINNSLVGTSKLLHFINPNQYAIWDSVVFKYLTGVNANNEQIKNASDYRDYLKLCKEFIKNDSFKTIREQLESKIKSNGIVNYGVSDLRAVEMIMYETQRLRNKEEKKNKKN